MRNLGRVIPRNTLLERIWGTDVDITNNSLDALVRLLRRKLEPEQPALIIRNIRGVGYTLEMEDSSSNRRTLTKKS
jgi:DNA-binding response OmpR family regulator